MSKKDYKELNVWKESRALVSSIYLLSKNFPEEERFGLTSQVKRAVISIPSNIAEGIGRKPNKETSQFCHIAKGSLYELETQLYLAFDLLFYFRRRIKLLFRTINNCKKTYYWI